MPESGIDLIQLSFLSWLESQESERQAKYAMFRDYYDGDHATQLTARMRKFLELSSTQEFNLNMCPIVVDALAERLKVTGFDCEAADLLREWWQANRMDAVQAVVHTAAVRDGDAYVLTEWDNERAMPRFTQENAYDGSEGLHVIYSDERRNEPVVAVKRWLVTSGQNVRTRRVNLYYPDRIEKYSDGGSGGNWQPYEEDGQPWPIPWTAGGAPIGIPVAHFRNKDQGYSFGESELEDVLPLQNGLNKSFIDLLAAADTTGFRVYTASAYDGSNVSVAPGQFLWSTSPDARISAIEPSDLGGLINLKDSIAADIAKITRTPLSYFQLTGQVAAAGTLKEQRSGLISKTLDRQVVFGNGWEDAMHMAARLAVAFGSGGIDPEAEISTLWADDEKPEPSELAAQVALLSQAQAASTRTKVRIIHPEWDDEAVDEEVAAIRDELGMDVPDPTQIGRGAPVGA